MTLTNSSGNSNGGNSEFSTPSSKRSADDMKELTEQSSSTKKICTMTNMSSDIINIDEENVKDEPEQKVFPNVGKQDNESVGAISYVKDVNINLVKVKEERYKE